ncbi:hypothetical protein BU17DRAFT_57063, partial [Hysterangium stoloniferum]
THSIVAIHGLDGHREKSFTTPDGVFWLCDFLPESIPNARILTYGYDARTSGENRSQQNLYQLSTDFLASLSNFRNRPLIFVAHSFGGIMLKNALIDANLASKRHLPDHQAIADSTYGIVFLGTPHQGIDHTKWTHSLLTYLSINRQTEDPMLKNLGLHSEALQQQLTQYAPISVKYHTIFCYEMYPTVSPGGSLTYVPAISAVVPGSVNIKSLGIHKDHMGLVQFGSKHDSDYLVLVGELQQMVSGAPLQWHKTLEKLATAHLRSPSIHQMDVYEKSM